MKNLPSPHNEGSTPTKSELEILHVLWQFGPSTVRTVNERLNEQREVNYSSTLKLMQLMEIKGLLQRDTNDRSHVYRPAENPEKVQTQVVNGLRDLAFGGSTSRLVMRALGDGSATPDELEEIKRLIEKMQKKG
ncbi:BlaI/MecI/CopY family transcriptional regulator [Haliscomenobacter sp.]|uniref:BlaI/MecI/CopY family transcriptional regulator n=1 Tax=Haliscomenobacter sp. TaxID=2717303 RepID=UPI0035942B11